MPKFFHPYHGSVGRFFEGDPSLIAYWQLQKDTLDNSGNGWNGTPINVIWDGIRAFRENITAAKFNGISSKIVMPKPNFSGNKITLMAWIRRMGNSYTLDGKIIDIKGSTNRVVLGVANPDYFNGLYLEVYSDPNSYKAVGGFNIPEVYGNPSRFCLVVGTYDGVTLKLFVNDRLLASTTASISFVLNSSFYIGQEAGDVAPRYFNGYIAEAAVFLRGLSDNEVRQYYLWATSAPKRYWFFSFPLLQLNTQLLLSPSLRTTEKLTGNITTAFNIKSGIKELLRPVSNINFSGVSQVSLGKIVQGVVRKILNPKGGGIIKNR